MVWNYCDSFERAPKKVVVDVDDFYDAVHGEQQLCLFNLNSAVGTKRNSSNMLMYK